jgi:hypothetical protein
MDSAYTIKSTFNLQGFLTATRADGIKLSATLEDPSVNGYIVKTNGTLRVVLFDSDCVEYHFVRLEGNLENYKNTIDLRIAEYDA